MEYDDIKREFEATNQSDKHDVKIEFKGDPKEYFRIWIVNLVLTVLTLGVYSAWAKVRNRKYIYRNTYIDGTAFDYHADPFKILKGRLMVVAFMGLLYAVPYFIFSRTSAGGSLFAILTISVIVWLLMPYIIVKGSMFNLRNTSFRNIFFDFNKCYGDAYKTGFLSIIGTVFTLNFGFPWVVKKFYQLIYNNVRFGRSVFRFVTETPPFYGVFIMFVVLMFVFNGLGVLVAMNFKDSPMLVQGMTMLFSYGGLLIALAFLRAGLFNITAEGLSIDGIELDGKMEAWELIKIYVGNALGVVFTLGLGIPWALLRNYKYKLKSLKLSLTDSKTLDQYVGESKKETEALSDAVTDFWDVDIGF